MLDIVFGWRSSRKTARTVTHHTVLAVRREKQEVSNDVKRCNDQSNKKYSAAVVVDWRSQEVHGIFVNALNDGFR